MFLHPWRNSTCCTFLFHIPAEWESAHLVLFGSPTWLPHMGQSKIHVLHIKGWSWTQTCWCFLSISSSSASTFVCFSFTFISSSSLAWSSSSWRVTWRRGFTCKGLEWKCETLHSPIYRWMKQNRPEQKEPWWRLSTTASASASNMQHNSSAGFSVHSAAAVSLQRPWKQQKVCVKYSWPSFNF